MPMPIPEHNEMENHLIMPKSGFASFPPMRMLPMGETMMAKVRS